MPSVLSTNLVCLLRMVMSRLGLLLLLGFAATGIAEPICSLNVEGGAEYGPLTWPNQVVVTSVPGHAPIETLAITVQRLSDGFYYRQLGAVWQQAETSESASPVGLPVQSLLHDHSYTITAVATDLDGLSSSCVATFLYDNVKPTGTASIGVGDPDFINSQMPTMSLQVVGADEVRFQNDGDLVFSPWLPFAPELTWGLKDRDGNRSVDMQFRDHAGNLLSLDDTVVLDRQPPTAALEIGLGAAELTNDPDVQLQALSPDSTQMRYYNQGESPGGWQAFQEVSTWRLLDGDGMKTVFGEFRDAAGNITPRSDQIELDTTPPEGGFLIAGDILYLEAIATTLTMSVTGADEMRIRNEDQEFPGTWETYASTRNWTLRDEDGVRTVFAQFRDHAGNVITESDDVIVDRTPPSCLIATAGTTGSVNALRGTAQDDESGIAEVLVTLQRQAGSLYFDGANWGAARIELTADGTAHWSVSLPDDLLVDEQSYTITAQARDNIGHLSVLASETLTVDAELPSCSIDTSGHFNASTWPGAVSGTVADTASFAAAHVTIRNPQGLYFNGAGWGAPRVELSVGAGDWSFEITLPQLDDGLYSVTCAATDVANNEATAAEQFFIDTVDPSGTFAFNQSPRTKSRSVTIALSISGATEMRFSNDDVFASWGPVFSGGGWELPDQDGLITVSAQFRDLANNVLETSAEITLDREPPVGTFSINPGNPVGTESPDVTLVSAVTGATSLRVRNANEAQQVFAYADEIPWTIPDSDGTHGVFIEYLDEAGNILPLDDTIILDREDPTCRIDVVPLFNAENWQNVISGTATDASSPLTSILLTLRRSSNGEYRQFNGSWAPGAAFLSVFGQDPWSYSLPLDQLQESETYTAACFATDSVGRLATAEETFAVDSTLPVCTHIVAGVYRTANWPNSLLGTATDANGIKQVQVSIERTSDQRFFDGDSWVTGGERLLPTTLNNTTWLYPLVLDNLSEGIVYRVVCEAEDGAGNLARATQTILIDDTPPDGTFAIGSGDPSATNAATVQLQNDIRGADRMRFANSDLGFGSWLPFSPTHEWELIATDGQRTVRAEFEDAVGNVLPVSDTIILDRVHPSCSITEPSQPFYRTEGWPGVFGTTADDRSGLAVAELLVENTSHGTYYDGNAFVAGQTELAVSTGVWGIELSAEKLVDGDSYALTCRVVDAAGNSNSVVSSFTLDDTPPVCTVDLPTASSLALWGEQVNITFDDATAPEASVSIRRQDGSYFTGSGWQVAEHLFAFPPGSWSIPLEKEYLSDDSYTVRCFATDAAGATTDTSATMVFDASPPTGSMIIGDNSGFTDTPLVFIQFDVEGAAEYRIRLADRPPGGWFEFIPARNFSLGAQDGVYDIIAEFRDELSNMLVLQQSVRLDTLPPTGTFTIGAGNPAYTASRSVDLISDIDDAARMRLRAEGGTYTAFFDYTDSISWALPDADGPHTVEVEYEDFVLNRAQFSDTIILDRIAPTCTIDTDTAFQSLNWPGSINGTAADTGGELDAVTVQILRPSDSRYFDGDSWELLPTELAAEGLQSWNLPLAVQHLDVGEMYEIRCLATDKAGLSTSALSTIALDEEAPECVLAISGPNRSATWPEVLTGTATDALGSVTRVELVVQRLDDAQYWSGAVWLSEQQILTAAGSNPWVLPLPVSALESGNTYRQSVRVFDNAGNLGLCENTFFLDNVAPTGTLIIDAGNPSHVAQRDVTLQIEVFGATSMKVANDQEPAGEPQDVVEELPWQLADLDGLRSVRLELTDDAGNLSIISDVITLDRVFPTGSIEILTTAEPGYTPTRTVGLQLTTDADEYRVSLDQGTFSQWDAVPVGGLTDLTLLDADGEQTVIVELRDFAGNTIARQALVTLDRAFPTGGFSVNVADPEYTRSEDVTLVNQVIGATQMRFRTNEGSFSDWQEFAPQSDWELVAEDGSVTVYAEYRDDAHNLLELSDSIIMDRVAPSGIFSIGIGDPAYSTLRLVTLSSAVSGALQMRLSSPDGQPTTWFSFTPEFSWQLEDADGERTVIAEFRDAAGNELRIEDSIVLDRVIPTCTIDIAGTFNAAGWPGTITGSFAEERTGFAAATVRIRRVFDGFFYNGTGWQVTSFTYNFDQGPWSIDVPLGFLGTDNQYQVLCEAQDNAGNDALPRAVVLSYDAAPPVCEFDVADDLGPTSYNGVLEATLTDFLDVSGTFALIRDSNGASYDGLAWSESPTAIEQSGIDWQITPPLGLFSDGSYTLVCKAVDDAGNASSATHTFVWDSTEPTGTFVINAGDPDFTTSRNVALVFNVPTAAQARFRNQEVAAFSSWLNIPVSGEYSWQLFAFQGPRTVYAEFRDAAGNVLPLNDTITLDTIFPEGSFSIDSGDPEWANSYDTTLHFEVAGANLMRLKNAGEPFTAWMNYDTSLQWDLLDKEGVQQVTAEFADLAGNVLTLSDTIVVDTVFPSGDFTINHNDPTYTNNEYTTLILVMDGVDEVRLGIDEFDFSDNWSPFSEAIGVRLRSNEGLHEVRMEARDFAGNTISRSDTIFYDDTAPSCQVALAAGYTEVTWPGQLSGTLTETGSGIASAELIIERQTDSLIWNGFNWVPSGSVDLSVGAWNVALGLDQLTEGARYLVTCRALDLAGNNSEQTQTFDFDSSPPTCQINQRGAYSVDTWPGEISGTITDSLSGVASAEVAMLDASGQFYFRGDWHATPQWIARGEGDWDVSIPYFEEELEGGGVRTLFQDGQTYTILCRATDNLGNSGSEVETFLWDTDAPNGTFTIGAGNPVYTQQRDVILQIDMQNTAQMRFRNEGDIFGNWLPLFGSVNWQLLDQDGPQTVTAEFRNDQGTIVTIPDTIILDRAGPDWVILNDGVYNRRNWTNAVTGVLSDSISGISSGFVNLRRADGEYYNGSNWSSGIHNFQANGGPWEAEIEFQRSFGSHLVTILASATDQAGNASQATGFLVFDDAPPECEVQTEGTFSPATWPQLVTATVSDALTTIVSGTITIERQSDGWQFDGAQWRQDSFAHPVVSTPVQISLPTGFLADEGVYIVTCSATDEAGNVGNDTSVFAFDALAPEGGFSVGIANPEWITTLTPTLDIVVADAVEMRFRIDSQQAFPDTWLPYASSHTVTLNENDGFRNVFGEFRDLAGNVLPTSDSFQLDVNPPSGTMHINAGDPDYTTARDITMQVSVTGAVEMRFREDSGTFSTWENIATTRGWVLQNFQGPHQMTGQFRDAAGNVLELFDTIILDTVPPAGVFTVGIGNPIGVNNHLATLRMSVGGATEMRFRLAEDPVFNDWRPYQLERQWTLLGADGEKAVVGQFRDAAGLVMETSDEVILDRIQPTCIINTAGLYTAATWPEVVSGANDDDRTGVRSGSVQIQRLDNSQYYNGIGWSNNPFSHQLVNQIWSIPFPRSTLIGGITYRVSCTVFDEAGNSINVVDFFSYDNEPPVCEIDQSGPYGPDTWPGFISGSVSDTLSGVAGSELAIQRLSDGYFYQAGAWSSTRVQFPIAGGGPWSVGVPLTQLTNGVSYRISCLATDNGGNASATVFADFLFDDQPPAGSFSIGDGDPEAINTNLVTLFNGIVGAYEMRFADAGGSFGDWQLFATTAAWELPNLPGPLAVDAEFRDEAGNVLPLTDEILFDITPPVGSLVIGEGNPSGTNDRNVVLFHNVTGAAEMRLANDNFGFGSWLPFAAEQDWLLTAQDGNRTVKAQYRDPAGNFIQQQDTILFDQTPPIGSFTIGATNPVHIDSPTVVLHIVMSGASEMRFANEDDDFEPWTNVTSQRNWTLPNEDGLRTVRAEFRDPFGNVLAREDTATLDRSGPVCSVDIAPVISANSWPGAVTGTTVDAVSGVLRTQVRIKRQRDNWYFNGTTWQPISVFITPVPADNWAVLLPGGLLNEGGYEVTCVGVDIFANETTDTFGFLVDSQPPECSLNQSGTYNAITWPGEVSGTVTDSRSALGAVSLTVRRETDNYFFTGSSWDIVPVSLTPAVLDTWQLAMPLSFFAGEHDYVVICTASDAAGNTRQAVAGRFRVDLEGPQGQMSINEGNPAFTTSRDVTIVSDLPDASSMFAQTVGQGNLSEMSYTTHLAWQLPFADGTYTVQVVYEDDQGNENTLNDSITLDRLAPSGTFTIGPGNPSATNLDSIDLISDIAGATQMRFGVAGQQIGPWETFAEVYAWPLSGPDGQVRLVAEYRDDAGNVFAASDTIERDTSGPIGSFAIGTTDPEYTDSIAVTLAFSVSGADQYRLRNDGQSFVDVWHPFPPDGLINWTLRNTDGGRIVGAEVRDFAGNTLSLVDVIILDSTAPTCTLSVIGAYQQQTWPGAIVATASDDTSGIMDATLTVTRLTDGFTFNGAGFVNAQVSHDITTLAGGSLALDSTVLLDGQYQITCLATDHAGNQTSLARTIFMDSQPPTCALTIPPQVGPLTWLDVVSGTAEDSTSEVALVEVSIQRSSDNRYFNRLGWQQPPFYIAAEGTESWSVPLLDSQLSDGVTYTVRCRVADAAGNQDEGPPSTFTFDATSPTGSLTIGEADPAYTTTASVSLIPDLTDAVRIRFRNESTGTFSAWADGSAPVAWTLLMTDGLRTVQAQLEDAAGNVTEVSDSIELDTVAPVVNWSLEHVSQVAVNSRTVTLNLDANEATTMQIDLAGSLPAPTTLTAQYQVTLPDQDGPYQIIGQFRDAAGNLTELQRDLELDRIAPAVTFRAGTSESTRSRHITLHITGPEVERMRFRHLGESFGAFLPAASTTPWTLRDEDGEQLVTAEFQDLAGNATLMGDFIFLDREAPEVTSTMPELVSITNWQGVTGTVDDLSGVAGLFATVFRVADQRSWNGSSWTSGSGSVSVSGSPWVIPIPAEQIQSGDYQIVVNTSDTLGNSSLLALDQFEVDADFPTCVAILELSYNAQGWPNSISGVTPSPDAASLALTVQRQSDDRYFSGSTWQSNSVDLTPTGLANWTVPLNVSHLQHGVYYDVTCRVTDHSGNVGVSVKTFVFDTQIPSLQVTPTVVESQFGANIDPLVGVTASDGIDGNPVIEFSPEVDPFLIGDQVIAYSAVDLAGNRSSFVNRTYRIRNGISGEVLYAGLQSGQTIVRLQDPIARAVIAEETLPSGTGSFSFLVQPGDYSLLAWMDSNGNSSYDDGEAEELQAYANLTISGNQTVSIELADWRHDYILRSGWNLLSVPGPTILQGFANVFPHHFPAVETWDEAIEDYIELAHPAPRVGFLLLSPSYRVTEVRGNFDGQTALSIPAGWSMLGPSQELAIPQDSELVIYKRTWANRRLDTGQALRPFEGYWIYAPEPVILSPQE